MRLWGVLFSLLLMTATEAAAQVRFGVKAGLNLTNTGFEKKGKYDVSNKAGFFVGPTVLFPTSIKGLEFDAAVLYDQRGADAKPHDLIGGSNHEGQSALVEQIAQTHGSGKSNHQFPSLVIQRQLLVPVHARYNLLKGEKACFFVFAGPELGVNVGKREYVDLEYADFVFNRVSFSIDAGLGLTLFRRIEITANYNAVLGKSADNWINREWGQDQWVNKCRMNALQFGANYYF